MVSAASERRARTLRHRDTGVSLLSSGDDDDHADMVTIISSYLGSRLRQSLEFLKNEIFSKSMVCFSLTLAFKVIELRFDFCRNFFKGFSCMNIN